MAQDVFIMAVGPDGNKRLVPDHYLDNPAFGFKLPPSDRAQEPAQTPDAVTVQEPAAGDTTAEIVQEPAAATTKKTTKRAGAAGETKEA